MGIRLHLSGRNSGKQSYLQKFGRGNSKEKCKKAAPAKLLCIQNRSSKAKSWKQQRQANGTEKKKKKSKGREGIVLRNLPTKWHCSPRLFKEEDTARQGHQTSLPGILEITTVCAIILTLLVTAWVSPEVRCTQNPTRLCQYHREISQAKSFTGKLCSLLNSLKQITRERLRCTESF